MIDFLIHKFLYLPVVLPVIAAMLLLRWRRVGMFTWVIAWWVAIWAVFSHGFAVPIPSSVVRLYLGIATAAIFAYVVSSRERLRQTTAPIVRLIVEPQRRPLLLAVLVLVPALVAVNVYRKMSVPLEAPLFGRTVHPAPPDAITVHEKTIDLIHGANPFRGLPADEFRGHVEAGRKVYFENCFYCHGDAMAGDGLFAPRLNPVPTNFTDPATIAQLQETFLFWRIAKGGPGMPEEGGPWDSAMPVWEQFLKEDEIWDVVLFLYDYTGQKPRSHDAEGK